ncbi:MAG: M13 family metallopeptidase [Acidobacteriales bacterium]|nr:M13 family metallopeptidase [Terriglobales bacterium]
MVAVCLFLGVAAFAQGSEKMSPPRSLDLSAIDKSVDPCQDFYQYACGGWRKANPIPGDKSRWGRFDYLAEYNRYVLKDILEKASQPGVKHGKLEAQVGDFYASCMDTKTIDGRGIQPLAPYLKKLDAAATKADLVRAMGEFRREGLVALFNFGVGSDLKDSNRTLMNIDQGGTSLPDRDYYLKPDPRSADIREKYVAYMTKMFRLAGDSAEKAAAQAAAILALETKLADAQLDRVGRRDPKNRDHKMSYAEMAALTPSFDFNAYFTASESPKFETVNVGWPKFFQALDGTWKDTPLDDLKAYVRWRLLNSAAQTLASDFEKANFDFYNGFLRGIKEQPPRWKTCVNSVDGNLGEALGPLYVAAAFGGDSKARMKKLVEALTVALEQDINQLDWMTPETKKKAVEKLKLLNKDKIGYPDIFRDYSSVAVKRDDFFGNNLRTNVFETKRNNAKLGKPVDKTEWGMTPPTVNAYYNPQFAEIVFPAGILQPPFFSNMIDDAVNFGGIGAVIGHELSHGFDDSGRKFDGKGNLQDWWTETDGKQFEDRAACIVNQYGSYSPVNDSKTGEPARLNGKLTLGENIGDNGGLRIAYMALMNTLAGKDKKVVDGFTPAQRFFLGFAQVWCQNTTDAESLNRVKTDPHSPGEFRANGTIGNMEEFQKAFSCKAGDKMAPEKRCRVW